MHTTGHDEVDRLLARLTGAIEATLGEQLAGLYLYGSLVTGDFDPIISDIDLLAVTHADVDGATYDVLKEMHSGIARDFTAWDDRVEVAYLSEAGLQTFRTERSQIVVISPGEPLNIKDAGADWLMNWYTVREHGIALVGLPPADMIAPIAREEFMQAVRDHAAWASWPKWIAEKGTRGGQAYVILTMCRALYSSGTGHQASKRRAAEWAQGELPEWREVIVDALAWREVQWDEAVDGSETYDRTIAFIRAANQLMGE